jgi:hypothetical protein
MTEQRKAVPEKHNPHPLDPNLMASPLHPQPRLRVLLKLGRAKTIKIEKRIFCGLQYNTFHRPRHLFQFHFAKLQGLNSRWLLAADLEALDPLTGSLFSSQYYTIYRCYLMRAFLWQKYLVFETQNNFSVNWDVPYNIIR